MNLPIAIPFAPALMLIAGSGLVGTVIGAWVGFRMAEGGAAIAQNVELRRQASEYASAASELRQRGLAVAQDFRTAQAKLEILTGELAHDLDSLSATFVQHRADLESLFAAHPEWGACDIGADGVRAWNAAATGDAATAAATHDPGKPGGTVLGEPADTDGREPAHADPELPRSSGDLSPLPDAPGDVGGGAP